MALAPLSFFERFKETHFGTDFASEFDGLFDKQELLTSLFQFHWNAPTYAFPLCTHLIDIYEGQDNSLFSVIKEPLRLFAAICGNVHPDEVYLENKKRNNPSSYEALIPATPENALDWLGVLQTPEFIELCEANRITLEFNAIPTRFHGETEFTAFLRALVPVPEDPELDYCTEFSFIAVQGADNGPKVPVLEQVEESPSLPYTLLTVTHTVDEEKRHWYD